MGMLSNKFQKLQNSLSLITTPSSKRHHPILDALNIHLLQIKNANFYERKNIYDDLEDQVISLIGLSEKGESRQSLMQHVCNAIYPYGIYPSFKFISLIENEQDRLHFLGVWQNIKGFADDAHTYMDSLPEEQHSSFIKSTIDRMDLSDAHTDSFTRTAHKIEQLIKRCKPEKRPDLAFLAIQKLAQAQVINTFSFNGFIDLQKSPQNKTQDVEYILEQFLKNNHLYAFERALHIAGISQEEMDECKKRVLAKNTYGEQSDPFIESNNILNHVPQ